MPRYFRPKGGFLATNGIVSIDDAGECHLVAPDGTATPHVYVDAGRVAMPFWSLPELLNMVQGGKWEEVEAPKPPAPAPKPAPPVQPAMQPAHTRGGATAGK